DGIRDATVTGVQTCALPIYAPDALFDEINLEAYGRWGGRRTLIAPAKPAGIDPRYLDWATYFDADIIYSFVKLDDAVVADLHEQIGRAPCRDTETTSAIS